MTSLASSVTCLWQAQPIPSVLYCLQGFAFSLWFRLIFGMVSFNFRHLQMPLFLLFLGRIAVLVSVSLLVFFCLVPRSRLSWLFASFWAHINILHRLLFTTYVAVLRMP